MAKQLMFYEQVVGLSPARHKDWYIEPVARHNFAKDASSVPVVGVEIPLAAREYAVVFAEAGEEIVPFVILGFKDSGNLYVTDDGIWDAKYRPAFVRRYPFIVSGTDDSTKFVLCIDESWDGCNQEGRGERLFDEDGQQTAVLNGIVHFQEEFQRHTDRTKLFCSRLKELDLLEPTAVSLTATEGDRVSLGGFSVVTRERLNAVSDEKLAEMNRAGELEWIYAHLLSLGNFSLIAERVNQRNEPATPNHTEAEGTDSVNDVEGIAS